MKGLLVKEFYTLRQQSKTLLIMLGMYIVIGFMQDTISLFSGMIVMVVAMLPITALAYDEHAKWDRYALSLPISRKELVISKYLLSFILVAIAFLISFIFSLVLETIKGSSISITETLLISGTCALVGLFFQSILLPIMFKYGTEKARGSMMLIFIVPTALILIVGRLGLSISPAVLQTLLYASPVIFVIAIIVSVFVSINIYQKKEF